MAGGFSPSSDVEQNIMTWVGNIARSFMIFGGIALLASVGVLVFTFITLAGGAGGDPNAGTGNVTLFGAIAVISAVLVGIGSAIYFWGEETLGPILLVLGGAMWAAPWYLPMIVAVSSGSPVPGLALGRISAAGIPLLIISILAITIDIIQRVQLRTTIGSKADQMKYGVGLKEERDYRNVFFGKCWQLPYCRKFVREACPIYHAKRTCWQERVGCMCEESVIRNAMSGKEIPKDMVAAAKYIPHNSRLTPVQKAERCRQCVIYNEHQKHKYKLMLGASIFAVVVVYAAFRAPFLAGLDGLLNTMDRAINAVAMREGNAGVFSRVSNMPVFQEIMLVVLAFIALAYLLKLIEFLCFKLKV